MVGTDKLIVFFFQSGGLRDESYGVGVSAVKLKRHIEMYQWEEERRSREFKEPDGSITTETEFSYRMLPLAIYRYLLPLNY